MLANNLSEAKYIMVMSTYAEHANQLYEESQKDLTEVEESQIKEELDIK